MNMKLECLAAIPPTASSIKIPGEIGECVRLQLDLYLNDPQQLVSLAELRGQSLQIIIQDEQV